MSRREVRYRVLGDHIELVGDRTALRHRTLIITDDGNVIVEHSDRRQARHDIYMSGAEARLIAREIIRHAIRSLFRRRRR